MEGLKVWRRLVFRLRQVKNTHVLASCLFSFAQHLLPHREEEVGIGFEQPERPALGLIATARRRMNFTPWRA